jgi:hypothetical protein
VAKAAVKKNLVQMPKNDLPAGIPRSLAIANKGVRTGAEFAMLMSALISDTIDGRITPQVTNAVCNTSNKLLKVVEMQHRWGRQSVEGGPRDLTLTVGVEG